MKIDNLIEEPPKTLLNFYLADELVMSVPTPFEKDFFDYMMRYNKELFDEATKKLDMEKYDRVEVYDIKNQGGIA